MQIIIISFLIYFDPVMGSVTIWELETADRDELHPHWPGQHQAPARGGHSGETGDTGEIKTQIKYFLH